MSSRPTPVSIAIPDVAYFWTHYNKYTKETDDYNGTNVKGTDIYNRTNKVFGLSLNYKF